MVAEKIAAIILATMKIRNVAFHPRLILSATAPMRTFDMRASPMRYPKRPTNPAAVPAAFLGTRLMAYKPIGATGP